MDLFITYHSSRKPIIQQTKKKNIEEKEDTTVSLSVIDDGILMLIGHLSALIALRVPLIMSLHIEFKLLHQQRIRIYEFQIFNRFLKYFIYLFFMFFFSSIIY